MDAFYLNVIKTKISTKSFLIFIFSNKTFTIAFSIRKCIQLIFQVSGKISHLTIKRPNSLIKEKRQPQPQIIRMTFECFLIKLRSHLK